MSLKAAEFSFDLTVPMESTRLILRRVDKNDLTALLDVHSLDEVTRFLPYATWKNISDAEAWYERILMYHAQNKARHFVVVNKEENLVIGFCLLFEFNPSDARAEIGFVLGRRYWGQGFMREALFLFLSQVFEKTPWRRIEAQADSRNVPSDRLLRALGFVREGLLRQRWVDQGEIRDVNIYGLLKNDWLAAASSKKLDQ